jgi:hypothetical protein
VKGEEFLLLSGTICLFLSPASLKSAGSMVLYRDIALPDDNGLGSERRRFAYDVEVP